MAEDPVMFADLGLRGFIRGKIDCAGRRFFRGINLVAFSKQQSEVLKGVHVSHCVVELFVKFHRFFHL